MVHNDYLYAAPYGAGVWKYSVSNLVSVKNNEQNLPKSFLLNQNYPNPFNPTSIIRFQIKDSRLVILKVYDIIGKEVETLVNEKKSPGTYEVTFDGSRLSSGIYFYTLTAGDFKETKKLVLLK
jgi:hypothetical protein